MIWVICHQLPRGFSPWAKSECHQCAIGKLSRFASALAHISRMLSMRFAVVGPHVHLLTVSAEEEFKQMAKSLLHNVAWVCRAGVEGMDFPRQTCICNILVHGLKPRGN